MIGPPLEMTTQREEQWRARQSMALMIIDLRKGLIFGQMSKMKPRNLELG